MKQWRNAVIAAGIVGASMAGGAIGVAVFGPGAASAQTSTASPSVSSTAPERPDFPAHGSAAHEDAEKAVTGDAAAKAQAAAVKSLGGGTAGAVTSDFTGNGYEVTVTKADGSQTEVHLDSAFNVMQRHGGPRGFGGPGSPSTTG